MSRIHFPRIGSFIIEDNGVLRLQNRPLTLEIQSLENDGIPVNIRRDEIYSTVETYIDRLLSCHDSRLRHQPNAVNDVGDCAAQMCALVLMRTLRQQFFDPHLDHGPFAPCLTDLSLNNILVDSEWN